jgi:DNA-binding NarL/FixJ family response regulator
VGGMVLDGSVGAEHEPRFVATTMVAVVRDRCPLHRALTSLSLPRALEVRVHTNVEAALTSVRAAPPSLALVECSLHRPTDGLQLCRELRAARESMWLILATPTDAVELRLEAFRMGVDDCVSASLDAREVEALLAARLKQVDRASGTFRVREPGPSRKDSLTARARSLTEAFELGQREAQILLMLAEGWAPKEISARCGCGYATVRTHLRRMCKKLSCSGTRELLVRFFDD